MLMWGSLGCHSVLMWGSLGCQHRCGVLYGVGVAVGFVRVSCGVL